MRLARLCVLEYHPVPITQRVFVELARCRAWQLFFEIDGPWAFDRTQMLTAERDQRLLHHFGTPKTAASTTFG